MLSSSVMLPLTILLTSCCFFFFNDTATTEIYTLSLHDALPISWTGTAGSWRCSPSTPARAGWCARRARSEEHTSELQSHLNLVCRLLLEKKNENQMRYHQRHAPV